MIGSLPNPSDLSKAFRQDPATAVSRHDQVSGFLVSAIMLAGLITILLGMLFVLNMDGDRKQPTAMYFFEPFSKSQPKQGVAETMEEPGVEEVVDVTEPQLADALEMVTRAVSSVKSTLETIDGPAEKIGPGEGPGDRRKAGPGGPDDGPDIKIEDAVEHWVVKYSTSSKEAYAAQLDSFKIEIGALSKDSSLIEYAADLSKKKPTYRKGTRKEERRVYFKKPNGHPVLSWDEAFLNGAGAETDDRYIFTFYPHKAISILYDLEQQALKRDKKALGDVKQTVFTVEPTKDGEYQYKLSQIRYR